ncbi:hypothetical protein BGZ76_000419 [Entomortierella beljakovae]|nr:hypothetical protein BGZ76_000419 [Entomortierella beljakovae]
MKQKGLPLRTFIQETLKRSRSSYSTLQTALFYLYKIRNKVPCAYLKRRQDQLYLSHQLQPSSQLNSGLMTPPASPAYFAQNLTDFSNMQGPDYFSLNTPVSKTTLPSPISSTCSTASASPAPGYSPNSLASPFSNSSSPASSSGSPCSVSSSTSSSSTSSSSSSSSTQSNRIIYCGRRTFLAALMVASKYLQDRNYSNKAWAKISGLSIKEINANELIFLKLIDYSLFVSHDTFMRWTALLVARGQEASRKFIQTSNAAQAAQASAFAARTMAMPPVALNGSHIRYGPLKAPSVESAPVSSEKEEAADVCDSENPSEPSRSPKMARTDTYNSCSIRSSCSGVISSESVAF